MGSLDETGMALSSKRNDPRLSRKYKEVRLKKLAQDGWTCFYCGYEGKDMTIDHIIPVSKAPELAIDIENMVTACKSCNSSKLKFRANCNWHRLKFRANCNWHRPSCS